MRLIDADEVKRFYKTKFKDLDNGVHWSRNDILMNLDCIETADIAPVIRCHNCKYFELNHWENVNGKNIKDRNLIIKLFRVFYFVLFCFFFWSFSYFLVLII